MSNTNFEAFEPSYTVEEFCTVERKSRVKLYAEWRQGTGPRYYLNGKRRIIPHSARVEYQQRKMAEASGEAQC